VNSIHRIIHSGADSGGGTQMHITERVDKDNYVPPDFTPEIESVSGNIGSSELTVVFRASSYGAGTPGIFTNSDLTGALNKDDFWVIDKNGNNPSRTIIGVAHAPGDLTATLTLSEPLTASDFGTDVVAARRNSIWGWYEGGYNNYATGIIEAHSVSAGPWPATINPPANSPDITLVHAQDGYNRIVVRLSEGVYGDAGATSQLQADDFIFTDSDGTYITGIEHQAGRTSATIILSDPIDGGADFGVATLAAAQNSVYDVTGNAAFITAVAIDDAALVGVVSSISSVEGVVGSDRLIVRFQSQVYSNIGETGALTAGDFTLSAGGKTINSVQHRAGDSRAIVTMSGPLTGGDIGTAAIAPAAYSIFGPGPGNFRLPADAVTVSAQPAPSITKVEGAAGYDKLTVFFSEGVYTGSGGSGALTAADFVLTDTGNDNNRSITDVRHNPGDSVAILTMDQILISADINADTLAAAAGEIFNSINNPAGSGAVIINGNGCPTWGTLFGFNEGAMSPTVTDDTGLLTGTVGNPSLSMAGDGFYSGDPTEAQPSYIDLSGAGYEKCLMSPRAFTLETVLTPGDVDLDYQDVNPANGFDDDYDVGDDPFGEAGDGRNYTGLRIMERQATFQFTMFRAGFAGDYRSSRQGKARVILKYRSDNAVRHNCPHPQWPDENYTGSDVGMHQISTDIDKWPFVGNHWYKIRIVFNSDKSDLPGGSNGTPVDIFVDDLGEDPSNEAATENWTGFVNASRTINESSSCKWGALPGDYVRTIDKLSAIGDNLNHNDVPGDKWNLMLRGRIDWIGWKPYADYTNVTPY